MTFREASGKKVSGGLHKFDASEVDIEGGAATADDFIILTLVELYGHAHYGYTHHRTDHGCSHSI